MYTGYNSAAGLGSFVAGSLGVLLLVYLAVALLGMLVSYLIIKAAVRNGVIEAMRKTGSTGFGSGTGTYINGWPPAQPGGAPAAPHSEYPGYGG